MSLLVFNSSPVSHFARAGELTALGHITADDECVITQAVIDEVQRGVPEYPALADVAELEWLKRVRVDSLEELQAFAEYSRRLGSGERNVGEASTLAWAETHGAIAVVDERAAARHADERGVEAHGTLWLVARGVRAGSLTPDRAERLISALQDAEAWFPSFEDGFVAWARQNGLL